MPSGSRGGFGGGGSRSSGSGSRGGFGGSRGGGISSYRPTRPIPLHFGRRTIILSTRKQSVLGVLLMAVVFALFILFVGITIRASAKDNMELYTTRHEYYQQMITTAENNPVRVQMGEITDILYDSRVEKWYFKYEIPHTSSHQKLPGESLASYATELMLKDEVGDIGDMIEFAINKNIVDENTDSINMSYKGVSIERDGDYLVSKADFKTGNFLITAGGIAAALFVVAGIAVVFIGKAKEAEAEVALEKKTAEAKKEAKRLDDLNYCPYCKVKITNSDVRCPSCGGALR